MAKLKRTWGSNIINLANKFKLYKSVVTAFLFWGCETWTLLADSEKGSRLSKPSAWKKLLRISYLEHRTNDWVRSKTNLFWNLLWQLLRDGNLHHSGMSHAKTTSLKPSFMAPWRVGDAVVGTGNVGWTTWKSGHPCPCQNCSQGPPAEKTGRRSCWIVSHVSPTTQSIKELNWTELK